VSFGTPSKVRLTRCLSGEQETARIDVLLREDAKKLINGAWWLGLDQTIRDPQKEPDRHWDWRHLVSMYQNKPFFRTVCVKTADGAVQAAMLFRVDARSALDADERALFVDRLATAPRNRDWLVRSPVYRGAGSGLLSYATAVSYSLGFGGRVNLFPIAHEEFYLSRGFVQTHVEQDGDPLFELPAKAALSQLIERGLLDA
jgi:hypothetical protein